MAQLTRILREFDENPPRAGRAHIFAKLRLFDFLILFLAKSFVNDKQIYIAALHINQILCNHINDKNQNSVLNSLSPHRNIVPLQKYPHPSLHPQSFRHNGLPSRKLLRDGMGCFFLSIVCLHRSDSF